MGNVKEIDKKIFTELGYWVYTQLSDKRDKRDGIELQSKCELEGYSKAAKIMGFQLPCATTYCRCSISH